MTLFLTATAIVLLAGGTLMVLAGREFLRVHGFPPHRVHGAADLVHLASLGYSALNAASNEAARRRINGPC
jgi:hypothetical protein